MKNLIIAKDGKYSLQHRLFLGRDKRTTFSLQLCSGNTAIAYLDKESLSLTSYENRLIESIETEQDVLSVKKLIKLLYIIYDTEEVEIE